MHEIAGNIHMHTPYSDGAEYHRDIAAAAVRAGLDFIVVTDHNVRVEGLEGYVEVEGGRVLLLIGEEVHHVRRKPQANHCLVIGASRDMAPHAADPQGLIDAVHAAGGYSFLAHPFDPAAPVIGEKDYAWYDWDVEGYTGLELWNYMSNWKTRIDSLFKALPAVFRPDRFIPGPDPALLQKWDHLLRLGRQVAVIGGSDGHGFRQRVGPWELIIYPYEDLFRAVNTHLLLEEPLTGDFAVDQPRVLEAIGRGRGWVGYDLDHPTRGFRFSAQSANRGTMGDEITIDEQVALQVISPTRANIRLLHQGREVAAIERDTSLTYLTDQPGAYRVEVQIPVKKWRRGWIYSNPIYLRE